MFSILFYLFISSQKKKIKRPAISELILVQMWLVYSNVNVIWLINGGDYVVNDFCC